jgi:hypothetical protein
VNKRAASLAAGMLSVLVVGCGSHTPAQTMPQAARHTSASAAASTPAPTFLQASCVLGNSAQFSNGAFVPDSQVVWAVNGIENSQATDPLVSGTVYQLDQQCRQSLAAGPFLTRAAAVAARTEVMNGGYPTDWQPQAQAAAHVAVTNHNSYPVDVSYIQVGYSDNSGNDLGTDQVNLTDSSGAHVYGIAPGQTVTGMDLGAPPVAANCGTGSWST